MNVSGAPRDHMHMDVHDCLTGGGSVVPADIESCDVRIARQRELSRTFGFVQQSSALVTAQLAPTRHVASGHDEQMARRHWVEVEEYQCRSARDRNSVGRRIAKRAGHLRDRIAMSRRVVPSVARSLIARVYRA